MQIIRRETFFFILTSSVFLAFDTADDTIDSSYGKIHTKQLFIPIVAQFDQIVGCAMYADVMLNEESN